MNFKKANNIAGWVIGGIATLVYLISMEKTASFWDCGEFASVADKMEVGHSPGAPLFMMLQRMFALLAGGNKTLIAPMINSFSAICSGLTILFLFWTITHLAKNIVTDRGTEPDGRQRASILGAGIVGALAYTFSDTFWFSAVEAEVYACSSFFTALTFWMVLKWENAAGEKYADRWLVLIMYMMGLTVGIHLLNLLAIPAVAMVYYFRRYKPTIAGTVVAFLAGCGVLGLVQFGIIQGIPILASKFELWFVNDMGMPYDSGALFFVVLLAIVLAACVFWFRKKGWHHMHTALLSLIFILIGFSSYVVPMIRSRADVPIDMTNPDDVISLVSYVQREQFGEQPLFYGPDFTAATIDAESKGFRYARTTDSTKDHYEVVGDKLRYIFDADHQRYFPRMWDNNDENHQRFYANFLGLEAQKDRAGQDVRDRYGKIIYDRELTTGDNLSFFMGYQMNWMWWRYFMWNYVGRQNDFEGQGDPKNGNWTSGLTGLDKILSLGSHDIGRTSKMADGYVNNGARNELYYLPFILGILGAVYQFNRSRRDGIVVGVLFFFTGIAIGIYLNMTPLQPRERDYAFAGSTYAYAIWIGLGVLMVANWMQKAIKGTTGVYAATGLCLLLVPALMLKENWDDHNRDNKTLARATAYNTLGSCEKNAILLTVGDNETYPLWYAQEIEGFRPDVRVINTSLLGIDWYIDQLNYKVNDADAVPMVWKHDHYVGDRRNYLRLLDKRHSDRAISVPAGQFVPLKEICEFITNPKMTIPDPYGGGDMTNYFPTTSFSLPSPSKADLIAAGLMYPADSARAINDMRITMTQGAYNKGELAQLNMIAAIAEQGWKRPIYFSNLQEIDGYGNLKDFFRQEGTVFRLMPYSVADASKENTGDDGFLDVEKTYKLFMNSYTYGGGERKDVYFDEKNRQMFIPYRVAASRLATELSARGQKADGVKVLDKVVAGISEQSYSYDYTMFLVAQAYYAAGDNAKAKQVGSKVAKNAATDAYWILSLKERGLASLGQDLRRGLGTMTSLSARAAQSGDLTTANSYLNDINNIVKQSLDLGGDQNIPISVAQMYGSMAYESIRKNDNAGFDNILKTIYALSDLAQKSGNNALNQMLNQMIKEVNGMRTPEVPVPVAPKG